MRASEIIRTEQAALTPPPEEAVRNPVPYGVWHMDLAFPAGVKPTSPQLNVIQGGSGARKTTLLLNIIIAMCLSGNLPEGHLIVYDTLENGMTIERIVLVLRAMIAHKFLIYKRHLNPTLPTDNFTAFLNKLFSQPLPTYNPIDLLEAVRSKDGISELTMTIDFIELWYRGKVKMTANQIDAWILAGDVVAEFPLEVFGISEHYNHDEAERRSVDTTSIETAYERWMKLREENRSVQVISDYLQAYWLPGGETDHYTKQKVIVPYYDRFVKQARSTLWALSQEGVTHQREFRSTGVVLGSSGGDVLKSASQNNWRVSYLKEEDPYHMIIHTPVKSRRGNHGDIQCMIEPKSGVLFGRSILL